MAQSPNQFRQTPEVGDLDLQSGINHVVSCVHLAGQSTPLVAGQAVKVADNYTAIPSVQATTIAEVAFGVAVRSLKDANYAAEDILEVARVGCYMQMQASSAIARGADVQYDPATNKVATKTSTNAILGQAYDKAGANNDIIRVYINPRSGA
jgi:hypothetical protein